VTGQGLPRSARIRQGPEIRRILRRGRRRTAGPLDVFIAPAPAQHSRFGAIVPKYGHRVVDRNRVRRRLREIGRIEVLPRLRNAGQALDVLVRARPGAYDATFSHLRAELTNLTERLCSETSPSA